MYTVRYGTPEQIEEQVKELLDIMAPGGGYLFTTGYSLEGLPGGEHGSPASGRWKSTGNTDMLL